MNKKSVPQTREDLLAALAALDSATEAGTLHAEINRLNAEVGSLVQQRTDLERKNRALQETLGVIRKAIGTAEFRHRGVGEPGSRTALVEGLAQRAAAQASARNRLGMQEGTHDPTTGLVYSKESAPQRDLSAGSPEVTPGEMTRLFPALSGPEVDAQED